MSFFDRHIRRHLRRPTIAEAIASTAIIVVLIALLIPGDPQWTGSGTIRLPVRLFVFDAANRIPVADAHVTIFRAPPLVDLKSFDESRDRYDPTGFDPAAGSTTAADGTVTIDFEFRTGISHKRPTSHAHLESAWVYVRAERYAGVVIPVRHDSEPTARFHEQKEILVPVGLVPMQ